MANRSKLTRVQWDAQYNQYIATPDPDQSFSETGEHWKLIALLNQLGHIPYSRQEAVRLAQELLDLGYDDPP